LKRCDWTTLNGDARASNVALVLCPAAPPRNTPGRQQIINRVGAVIRQLEADGLAVRTGYKRTSGGTRVLEWAIANEEAA
jgi:hypothetical protein